MYFASTFAEFCVKFYSCEWVADDLDVVNVLAEDLEVVNVCLKGVNGLKNI